MEDLSIYLPRDKHDFERVYNLPNLNPSIVTSIIPRLVEWLQDINWPIATEIAEFLIKHSEQTIPHIVGVLKTTDDIWKEYSLEYFVKKLPVHLIQEFQADLIRIAYTPTEGEKLEEVNETAKEILEMIDNIFVWGIFVADSSKPFPNFFPVGLYTSRELAIKQIETMPRDNNYQLFRMPINKDFSYYHKKNGKLIGMDAIHHEHFNYKDDSN